MDLGGFDLRETGTDAWRKLWVRGGFPRSFLARGKFADAPGTTRSMRVALKDLKLDHLWIVYPGDEGYVLDDRISALPVAEIGTLVERIGSKGW